MVAPGHREGHRMLRTEKLRRRFCASLLVGVMVLASHAALAQTLRQEVDYCKANLAFNTLPPASNCFAQGSLPLTSRRGGPSRLNYFRLGEQVDAVLHCEGVDEATQALTSSTFVLMTIHNRSNGYTCFYERGNNGGDATSPAIPSLNTANATQTGAADHYWQASTFCKECHTASGPYLMDGGVHAMSVFGLTNNGHDTHDEKY